jgi:hypothetical protein
VIAAALLMMMQAVPLGADGPDARFDCVLGPRGTRDRDRVLTMVLGGYVTHSASAQGWSGPADALRLAGAKGLFKGATTPTVIFHPAGGIEVAAKLADGRDALLTFGKPSEAPGTAPLNLDVKGSPSYPPLSGGCTITTGDFQSLATGVGS